MSLTYRDQIFMAPIARPAKREDPHSIGRSPRFAPGWWLMAVAIFYVAVAVAALCIFVL
jgi:hypothetical protein